MIDGSDAQADDKATVEEPETIGQLELNYAWYNTAEDTLEQVEDGFLFYLMGRYFGGRVVGTNAHGDEVPFLEVGKRDDLQEDYVVDGDVAVAGLKFDPEKVNQDDELTQKRVGSVYERYLAQRLSSRFWKGGQCALQLQWPRLHPCACTIQYP